MKRIKRIIRNLTYNKYLSIYSWDRLPWYIGPLYQGWSLAIWNCGFRPQTKIQVLKDIRITIRYKNFCVFVLKRGDGAPFNMSYKERFARIKRVKTLN